jgi:hypothetical protein
VESRIKNTSEIHEWDRMKRHIRMGRKSIRKNINMDMKVRIDTHETHCKQRDIKISILVSYKLYLVPLG